MEHISEVPEKIPDPIFFHSGISYDRDKNDIKFSNEAIETLQNLISTIQSSLSKNHITPIIEAKGIELNEKIANTIADAMLISGKGKKATGRFLDRVMSVLRGEKSKGSKTEEKIEKKIQKFGNNPYVHIYIQYPEGSEIKILENTPMIVRSGEDIETMMKSLRTRLRFSRMKK